MSDFAVKLRAARQVAATMRAAAAQFGEASAAGGLDRTGALGHVIGAFASPLAIADDAEPAERMLALLHAFDRHGDGLRPFTPTDPVAPGDVLIAADRALWIVDAVNADHRATALVGGRTGSKAPVVLHWQARSDARAWLAPGQFAGAAYRDPAAALADLAGQWGMSESATRYFKRPEALFWQLTETPGVRFGRSGLDDEADEPAVRAWLMTRGAGPVAQIGAIMPGDLFWQPAKPGFSIILRAEGVTIDTLSINRDGPGPIGEKRGEAMIGRGMTVPPEAMLWRPA